MRVFLSAPLALAVCASLALFTTSAEPMAPTTEPGLAPGRLAADPAADCCRCRARIDIITGTITHTCACVFASGGTGCDIDGGTCRTVGSCIR